MAGFVTNKIIDTPRSKEPQIDLRVEVYTIGYDWGIASMGRPIRWFPYASVIRKFTVNWNVCLNIYCVF